MSAQVPERTTSLAAGAMNRRVLIQRPVEVYDAHGQREPEAWADVGQAWALVTRAPGTERFQADQRTSVQTATFTIRWRTGIEPGMRVISDGQAYDIRDVGESGTRDLIVLTCEGREVRTGR
ncbi:MAG: phage head closure protein [Phycisphaerales bacterium]